MKLEFSAEDQAFRAEVRAFVAQNLSPRLKRKVELGLRIERADYVEWYTKLYERGWITPSWPKEAGGPGWTPLQRYIFDEETLVGGAPRIVASGINMLGPVLNAFGTPAQKARFLPAIRRSETWWAQGFSEPGAGSDLAAVRTSAVPDGDGMHFIVNGHKIWTSYAHWCDMMFALVRTDFDVRAQEGISFLLIDMHAPGVTVRPIRMLEGGTDLNEVFLDDVRVPVENLVGEINKGWSYGKYLLGHERTGIAGIGSCKQQLARAKKLGQQQGLAGDALFEARVSRLEIELMALEFTGLRMLCANQASRVSAVEASMLKVRGTELRQAIYALLADIAGPHAVPFDEAALLDQAGYDGANPAPAPADLADSANPTALADLANPAAPTDPANPTALAGPANPVAPTDPASPTALADPANPAVPTDPASPTALADPANPAVPTDPANPTALAGPANPAAPTDPASPTALADPANPAVPTDPANPTALAGPANPAAPTDPVNPAALAGPANPAAPTNPASPADPVALTHPADLAALASPADPDALVALAANYFDARKLTIYGGTSEVQRNLISRAYFSA